jgi:hypothetical protein
VGKSSDKSSALPSASTTAAVAILSRVKLIYPSLKLFPLPFILLLIEPEKFA